MTNERNLQSSEIPNVDTMVERNLAKYALATVDNDCYLRGYHWYQNAHDQCVLAVDRLAEYGIKIDMVTFSTIVAIVSPGRSWQKNIPDASTTVIAYYRGEDIAERIAVLAENKVSRRYGIGAFSRSWSLLDNAYTLDYAKSPKAFSFAHNILHPNTSPYVTIDQHNCHVLLGEDNVFGSIGISPSQYKRLEVAMFRASELLALPALKLQAIIWQWRQEYVMGLEYDDSSASMPTKQANSAKRQKIAERGKVERG